MARSEIRKQWEGAAPGWAKWEKKIAEMLEPATNAMFEMAGIVPGAQVPGPCLRCRKPNIKRSEACWAERKGSCMRHFRNHA